MGALLSDGLFMPALLLAMAAFVMPRALGRLLPEGVRPLLINVLLSTVLLFVVSAIFFFCLYLWQGLPLDQIVAPGIAANVVFFGRLGLAAAIIWAPIMLLSVAGLPRKWVKETW